MHHIFVHTLLGCTRDMARRTQIAHFATWSPKRNDEMMKLYMKYTSIYPSNHQYLYSRPFTIHISTLRYIHALIFIPIKEF